MYTREQIEINKAADPIMDAIEEEINERLHDLASEEENKVLRNADGDGIEWIDEAYQVRKRARTQIIERLKILDGLEEPGQRC